MRTASSEACSTPTRAHYAGAKAHIMSQSASDGCPERYSSLDGEQKEPLAHCMPRGFCAMHSSANEAVSESISLTRHIIVTRIAL